MKTAIIQTIDGFVCFDATFLGKDYEKDAVYGIVDDRDQIDVHECISSALWKDTKDYIDELQNEEALPEGQYLVLYFRLCEDGSGHEPLVDFDISKEEIIENVKAQKYREEARYYPMSALHKPNIETGKKTIRLAVTWEMAGYVEVEASSLEEAMDYFDENSAHIALPSNAAYVDGSFQLATSDPDEMSAYANIY